MAHKKWNQQFVLCERKPSQRIREQSEGNKSNRKKNTKEKAKTESTKQSNESTTNYRRKMHSNWVAQCITNTQQQSSVQIFTLQIEITNKQCKICYCLYPIWFIWKWNVHHCDCPLWIFFLLTHVWVHFHWRIALFNELPFSFSVSILWLQWQCRLANVD